MPEDWYEAKHVQRSFRRLRRHFTVADQPAQRGEDLGIDVRRREEVASSQEAVDTV